MSLDDFREYCLQKKGVTEDFPFDEVTLCLRVLGKIFAITGLDGARFAVALKADPEYAVALREQYPEVQPGWHMNKTHWNTVDFEGGLGDRLLQTLIDHSYEQVVRGLRKKDRELLAAL